MGNKMFRADAEDLMNLISELQDESDSWNEHETLRIFLKKFYKFHLKEQKNEFLEFLDSEIIKGNRLFIRKVKAKFNEIFGGVE